MPDFTKPADIVDTPGVQTGKQAIFALETNQDALILDYNGKFNRTTSSTLNTAFTAIETEVQTARGGTASLSAKFTAQDSLINSATTRVSELNTIVATKAPLVHTHANDGSTFTTTPVFEAVKTTNFTAEIGKCYLIDTSAGSVEMTLPPLPADNDTVIYRDYANTFDSYPLVIKRNASGEKIFNIADDFSDRTKGATRMLVKIGTRGWR